MVELLLKRGVSANATDNSGRTPLHLAAGTGVVDVARTLVEGRADLSAVGSHGKNAMDKALRSSGTMAQCPHPPSTPRPHSRHARLRAKEHAINTLLSEVSLRTMVKYS